MALSEFAALALPLAASADIELVTHLYPKMPVEQSTTMMRVLIRHMSTSSDDSTDAAADLLLSICTSLRKRALNETIMAVPLIEGLESESISCRSGVLTALNELRPNHGSDDAGSRIEDYLSHRTYSACHSEDESLARVAKAVMAHLDLFPPEDSVERLCNDSGCGVYHLQRQAAFAQGYINSTVV